MLDNVNGMSQYENEETVMLTQIDIFQQQQMQTTGLSLPPPPPSQVNIMTGVYTLQEEPEETEENAMWIQTEHLVLINFSICDKGKFRRSDFTTQSFNMFLCSPHEKCLFKLHLAGFENVLKTVFSSISEPLSWMQVVSWRFMVGNW